MGSVITASETEAIYGDASYAWTINNAGMLRGSAGIVLRTDGSVGNTGLISGDAFGVDSLCPNGTVSNQGNIVGPTGFAVAITDGIVTNGTGALIAGKYGIVMQQF